jgi:predicted permease
MDFREYVRSRLPSLGVPREPEIVDELAQHLEDLYRESLSAGLDHDAAFGRAADALTAGTLAADLRASSSTAIERTVHRATSTLDSTPSPSVAFSSLRRDFRHAARSLLRAPAFAAIAALTLGLGMGATAVIFSGIDALLIEKPAIRDPDRVVQVHTVRRVRGTANPSSGDQLLGASYPHYADLRDSAALDGLAAFTGITLAIENAGTTDQFEAEIVSGNYFEVLGVPALLGRVIGPDDDRVESPARVVVLSHRLWQTRFGARPDVVGQILRLNENAYTVIGVAPRGFAGPLLGRAANVWVPMALQPELDPVSGGPLRDVLGSASLLGARGVGWLDMVGRLGEGQTIATAAAALDTVGQRLAAEYPDSHRDTTASPLPLGAGPGVRANARPVLGLLSGAVALVLLIACANVANLLLTRGLARHREIAVRMALGAGRAQVVRQWLAEAVLLGLLGAGVGLVFAWWGTPLLYGFGIPPAVDVALNGRVLALTLGTGVTTGLVFGLAPIAQLVRLDPAVGLRDRAGFVGTGGRAARARGALVVLQVALSFVLLVGAGLLARTLQEAYAADLGYTVDRMLLVDLSLDERYAGEAGRQLYADALERVNALPGVTAAGAARITVLTGRSRTMGVSSDGQPMRPDRSNMTPARVNVVSQGYLEALGIPILAGRDFDGSDGMQSPSVAIVSRSLAERLWPGEDPIGRMLVREAPLFEVVGVVPDTVYLRATEQEPLPFYYLPLSQQYEDTVTLHVRTAGEPMGVLAAVRDTVRDLDPRVQISNARRLVDEFRSSMSGPRTLARLAGILSGVAILLAAVGLYAVLAYSVRQRAAEVGLRVALGANRLSIVKLVVGLGMRLVATGAALGVVGAIAAMRLVRNQLFGIEPSDPAAWIAVVALLILVGATACAVPVWRALRVPPATVLRNL